MSKSKRNFKGLLKDLKRAEERSKPKINPTQKLSLCMIVKDEEKFLAGALESVQGVVDEIIIVDTGSTDKTPEIARRFGAKLFFREWEDNFSIARNESLKHATGDWVLIMDADERIPEDKKDNLRSLLVPVPGFFSYHLYIENFGKREDEAKGHYVTRLFKRTPEVQFFGPLHEQLFPRGAEVMIPKESFFLEHYGYQDAEHLNKKIEERNNPILEATLKEMDPEKDPLYSFYAYYLGASETINHEESVKWLKQSIATSSENAPHLKLAYYTLLQEFYKTQNVEEGLQVGQEALERIPEFEAYPEFLAMYGLIFILGSQPDQAIEYIEKAIQITLDAKDNPQQVFHTVRFFHLNWRIYANLGLAYQFKGDETKAQELYKKALEICPKDMLDVVIKHIESIKGAASDSVVSFLQEQIELEAQENKQEEINHIQTLSNIYLEQNKPYEALILQSQEFGPERAAATGLELAQLYEMNQRNDMALKTYEAILEIDPNCFKAHLGLQVLSWVQEGITEFTEDAYQSLSAKASSSDDVFTLAEFLLKLGEVDRAKTLVETQLDKDAEHYQLLMMRAAIAQFQEDFDLAESELKALIEKQPGQTDAQVQLGNLYLAQQKFTEAEELYKALLQEQEDWYCLYALGVCEAGQNKLNEAREYLEKSLALAPHQASTQEMLTMVNNSLAAAT